MKISAISAVILLPAAISATPASAGLQNDVAQSNTAKSDAANPDDKPVCRRVETIGTRLAPRVCATKTQWKERDEANRAAVRQRADTGERD